MQAVTSVEELQALYGTPVEASIIKVMPFLTPEYRQMLQASPFVALATVGPEGLDCSPRGDAGKVIHIEDERTLMLPDWRGNNRIDSLANIVRDPRVALMFLIPGSNNAMRVNGKAIVTVDAEVTGRFVMDGRHPRSVVVITIEEVYPQCARALIRADLWNPDKHHDPKALPTIGAMMQTIKETFDGAAYDRDWPGRAKITMW